MNISKAQIKQYRNEQKILRARRKERSSDTACTEKYVSEYQKLCHTQIEHESLIYLECLNELLSDCSDLGQSINIKKYIDEEKRIQQLKQDIYEAAMDAYSAGDYSTCKRFLDVVGDTGQLYSEIQKKVQETEKIRKAIVRRGVSLAIFFVMVFVVTAVLSATYIIIPHNMLSKAQELSQTLQYNESIEQYEILKNYKKSKAISEESVLYGLTFLPSDNDIDALIIETKYLRAVRAFDSEHYDYALSEFQTLGEYKDSKNMALESLYQEAKKAKFEKEYESAIELFSEIVDYSDSKSQIVVCKELLFEKGMTLYEKNIFDASNTIFQYLNGYNDSLNYIHKHEYKHSSIKQEPTCENEGIGLQECWCGDITEYSIPALGHKYSSEITQKPTCTHDGAKTITCNLCGYSFSEKIPKTGHSYNSEIKKQPACEADGVKKYTCSLCGNTYEEKINAFGHKYTTADCTHDSHCTNCGKVIKAALGHDYNNGKCTRCGLALTADSSFNGIWNYDSDDACRLTINLSNKTAIYEFGSFSYYYDNIKVISPTEIDCIPAVQEGFPHNLRITLISAKKILITPHINKDDYYSNYASKE